MRRELRTRGFVGVFCAAFIGWFAGASTGDALEFEVLEPRQDGCFMRLSGAFEAGDADRFHAALVAYFEERAPDRQDYVASNAFWEERLRVCLDSEGGNFAEAMRMIRVLQEPSRFPVFRDRYSGVNLDIGTRVAANSVCLSACAVFFMAGGQYPDGPYTTRYIDRTMHPTATIGFHTPNLPVPEGERYTERQVQQAYQAAMHNLGEIADAMVVLRFPPSLLQAMLSAGPVEFEYVDEVGEATAWGIDLYDHRILRDMTMGNLAISCFEAGMFLFADLSDDQGAYLLDTTRHQGTIRNFWNGFDDLFWLRPDMPTQLDGDRLVGAPWNDMGDHCEWYLDAAGRPERVSFHPFRPDPAEIRDWHLLPPATPISLLSRDLGDRIDLGEVAMTERVSTELDCIEIVDGVATQELTCTMDGVREITFGLDVRGLWAISSGGSAHAAIGELGASIDLPEPARSTVESGWTYNCLLVEGTETGLCWDENVPL
jgi:hypothetical protein